MCIPRRSCGLDCFRHRLGRTGGRGSRYEWVDRRPIPSMQHLHRRRGRRRGIHGRRCLEIEAGRLGEVRAQLHGCHDDDGDDDDGDVVDGDDWRICGASLKMFRLVRGSEDVFVT